MRTLSLRVRNWCVHWAYQSETGACTEHTHQLLIRAQSAVPLKHDDHDNMGQELMHALSVHVRNWCACSACASEIKWCLAAPIIKVTSLYFSPKVTYPETLLWSKSHENPSDQKSHTWAPLNYLFNKLFLHNKTNTLLTVTKNITNLINFIFFHTQFWNKSIKWHICWKMHCLGQALFCNAAIAECTFV